MKKKWSFPVFFVCWFLVSCSSKSDKITLQGSIETSLGKLEMVEKRTEIEVILDAKKEIIRPQENHVLYAFTFSGKSEVWKLKDGFPLIDSSGSHYLPVFEGTPGAGGIPSRKEWVMNGTLLFKDGNPHFVGTITLPRPRLVLVYQIPRTIKDLAFIDAKDNGRAHFIVGKSEKEFQAAMPTPQPTVRTPKRFEVFQGISGGFAGGVEGIPDLETRRSWWKFKVAGWRLQDSLWTRFLPGPGTVSPAEPGSHFVCVELHVQYSGDVFSALDANDIILVDGMADEYRAVGIDRLLADDDLRQGETDASSPILGENLEFYIYSNSRGETFTFYISQVEPGGIMMKIGKPAGHFVLAFEIPKEKTGLKLRFFGAKSVDLK